ncbi:MAG: hydrophobe/amphiphile efflux-3 (HAE3) family transporter [Dehalococcoidia bacterium]
MKRIFEKLGDVIEKRYWLVVTIALALLVASFFASGMVSSDIDIEMGTETMISTDTREFQDYTRFNQDFGSDIIMVMIEGDNLSHLLSLDNLTAMEHVEDAMGDQSKYPEVIAVTSPAVYIKQAAAQQNGTPQIPLDESERLELVKDPVTGAIAEHFRQVLPGEQYALVAIVLEAELDFEILKDLVSAAEKEVDKAGFSAEVTATVTGEPALMSQVEDMMMESLGQMVLVSIALLFIILALIFKVRGFFAWRWLPLGVVIVGTIYTFGLMGILSVPLTMISMAVFPVLIGLGIDYGIQFHNRYDEEAWRGQTTARAIIESITHIGPAVGIALIAGCLGFVALQFSPVPMIKDFGLMLIIGVIAAYVVAMFPLLASLYWHDRTKKSRAKHKQNKPEPQTEQTGFVERSLQYLAPRIIKNPFIIIPIAIALAIGGIAVDSRIDTVTDETMFISQDLPAVKTLNKVREVAQRKASLNILIEAKDNGSPGTLEPATLQWMLDLEQRILENGGSEFVTDARSIADMVAQASGGNIPADRTQVEQIVEGSLDPTISKNLISDDLAACNMIIDVGDIDDEQAKRLINKLKADIAESNPPKEVSVALTGMPVLALKVLDAITSGRNQMTMIGVGLIFGGLLLLFRFRLIRAILATLPILMIVGWSALSMYVLGIEFTPLTATLGALIMGIGVEFTILLMMRYYEERGKGENPAEAMATAMTKIGRAVSVSAFTTIGGFAALLIARDFPILVDFGIVTMTNVFFALAASLLVLPSLVVFVDRHAEKQGLQWLR